MRLIDADALLKRLNTDKEKFEHDPDISAIDKDLVFAILENVVSEVNSVPTYSPWVKINSPEDLPPEREKVIIIWRDEWTRRPVRSMAYVDSEGRWHVATRFALWKESDITHWMPQPQPPEMEDDSNEC